MGGVNEADVSKLAPETQKDKAWSRCAAPLKSCQGWFSLLLGPGDLLIITDRNQINKIILNN